MSAKDDYPEIARLPHGVGPLILEDCEEEAGAALREIDRLRQWKAEAMTVLAEWDAVWEVLDRPGPLGGSKAANVLALIRGAAGSPARGAALAESVEPPLDG